MQVGTKENPRLSFEKATTNYGSARRHRRGSVLQSVLVLSLVFVVLSGVVFVVANGIWPEIDSGTLARPFLGAFSVWAVGVGVAVALTRPRVLPGPVVVRSEAKAAESQTAGSELGDRAQHWLNLAEYWRLQVDATGAEMMGARGPIRIRCRDNSRAAVEYGKSTNSSCYMELSGIPQAFGFDRLALEAARSGAKTSTIVLEVIRPGTRATVARLLRSGAQIGNGVVSIELPAFDEDIFDGMIEMCEDLADTKGISSRLIEYYRHGSDGTRARLYLDAIFGLPATPYSMQLASEKLRDPDFMVRVAAASHLGDQGSHVLELIVARANSGLDIRLSALAALSKHDAERAMEVPGARDLCVQALRTKDDSIVLCAIQALEHIGDRRVVPLLVPLMNANHRFRAAGKQAVEAINLRR